MLMAVSPSSPDHVGLQIRPTTFLKIGREEENDDTIDDVEMEMDMDGEAGGIICNENSMKSNNNNNNYNYNNNEDEEEENDVVTVQGAPPFEGSSDNAMELEMED